VLVVRMAIGMDTRVLISGRTVTDKAALVIDARLGAQRRCHGALPSPVRGIGGVPLKGLLSWSQHTPYHERRYKATYIVADAPDGVNTQRLDGAIGGIDRVEFDAEVEQQLVVNRVHVDAVAESAKHTRRELDRLGNHGKIFGAQDPCSMLRVGLDQEGKLDLALKLIELGGLLGLGDGKVVAGNIVDSKVMLLQDILGLCRVMKIIEAKMDATSKDRNTVGEAGILAMG